MLLKVDDIAFVRRDETGDVVDQPRAVGAVDEESGSIEHNFGPRVEPGLRSSKTGRYFVAIAGGLELAATGGDVDAATLTDGAGDACFLDEPMKDIA